LKAKLVWNLGCAWECISSKLLISSAKFGSNFSVFFFL
jgi:hypothetical protein